MQSNSWLKQVAAGFWLGSEMKLNNKVLSPQGAVPHAVGMMGSGASVHKELAQTINGAQ